MSHHATSGAAGRQIGRRGVLRVGALLAAVALALTSYLGLAAGPTNSHLVAVGPISSDTGFPTWYKDSLGTRLELCLEANNPLCGFLPGDVPNPGLPLVVPDNFPEEAFWMLGSAGLDTGGGRGTLVLALEAAFANAGVVQGDQISFGRVRIWVDTKVAGNYKVTHPYGTDLFPNTPVGTRGIRFTDDIGIGVLGDFAGALNSRIGPFLKWPSGAPAGFIGDPGVEHAVTGSPYNTNFYRVEGPAGAFAGSTNLCADATLGNDPIRTDDCIETSLFSLMGKLATNAGVNINRATYSRDNTGTFVDLFASSESDQSIQAPKQGTSYPSIILDGDGTGRYYGRIAINGALPSSITIRNVSDEPDTSKASSLMDVVTITELSYDVAARTLTVKAESSDKTGAPTLTAQDSLGVALGTLSGGTLTLPLSIAPDLITVQSSAGGFDSQRVTLAGAGFAPAPLMAVPGAEQSVQQGQTVTLNGGGSLGDIDGYSWTQTGGPSVALSGASSATATFVAPAQAADLTFQLTVSRNLPPGTDSATVVVRVLAPQAAVANAGPDQIATRGTLVTLDGTASVGAASYAWTQTAGNGVVLSNATAAKPTFTFPADFNGTLTFQLTVTGPGGSASDTVSIAAAQDTLTLARAQYTRSKNEWRFDGTATILGPTAGPGNTITLMLNKTVNGFTTSVPLGTAAVDNLGAWTLRFTTTDATKQPTAASATYTVTITSSRGGLLANQAVVVRN